VATNGMSAPGRSLVSTFSIVARDLETGDLGVAVQSKFFGVGAVVPWARAGIGAIATQSLANVTYGERGLALLQAGWTARAVVSYLTGTDPDRADRQIGVVDRFGNAAQYTGDGCYPWAGGQTGPGFCVQGNILVSQDTTDSMADAYSTTPGSFPERLIAALEAGQAAGGDSRGQQSATILVVRDRGGYGGGSDRLIDLRVEDHEAPIEELRRLLDLHRVFFGVDDVDLVPLDDRMVDHIREQLEFLGYLPSGSSADRSQVLNALESYAGTENLEERLRSDEQIDTVILSFLEQHVARARR
jgi:uncharacterized Ntn-hydrolase superfamily protein